MRSLIILLLILVCASPALASDGVLEINHACALNTGCFGGDVAGYPVTIDGSSGRSYQLTSDLIVPDENTDGITLSGSYISLDLKGFAIIRSGCEMETINCTPASGTGTGVRRANGATRGTSIKHGSIVGMGDAGVILGNYSDVRELRVRWSRQDGINVGNGSTVVGNTSSDNGTDGIQSSLSSVVTDNVTYDNGGLGIFASLGSTVSGNSSFSNGSVGISSGVGSTVTNNSSYNNGNHGFFNSGGSTISQNTAYLNLGDGINSGFGSTIQRNTLVLNVGFGLTLNATATYRENTVTNNSGGSVTGGVNMGSNSCNGTTTCP